jgi:site-specific recombinase XerD
VFQAAKRKSGITKEGGIHSLRHAYATHQLESGLPVHQLQRLLGHGNLQSTMRYIHWVPGMGGGTGRDADLIEGLGVRHG